MKQTDNSNILFKIKKTNGLFDYEKKSQANGKQVMLRKSVPKSGKPPVVKAK